MAKIVRNTLLILFLISTLASTSSPLQAQRVEYKLAFAKPNTHLMEVSLRVDQLNETQLQVAMPYWAPGVYIAEEFAQQVQNFRVETVEGKPLPFHKLDGQTWSIETGRQQSVVIHYKIYANGMFFRGAHYDEREAAFSGPAVWMYLPQHKDLPISLTIDRTGLPAEWKIATGLSTVVPGKQYSATDYDTFADRPIEISKFQEQTFTALGTKYHVVVNDRMGGESFEEFTNKLHTAIEKGVVPLLASAVQGPLPAPFPEYWFLIHVAPGIPGAGVEHLNSTTITIGSGWKDSSATTHDNFKTLAEYKVALAVHEFFHAWNVKRLHPMELGPFDYAHPVHTESLWISEGLTDYYTDVAMLRAGLITPAEYLERIGRVLTAYDSCTGRKERSLADSSWDTWFGFHGSGSAGASQAFSSNLENTTCSYYEGGHALGLVLDLEIRQATHNKRSLDDWMQEMYRHYALPKPGFTPQDAVQVASQIAGTDMQPFFDRFVKGNESFPYEKNFAFAGIEVKRLPEATPWTGMELRASSKGLPAIQNIVPDSPAELAGLDRGDLLVAEDGHEVTLSNLDNLLQRKRVGDEVQVQVLRTGEFRTFTLTLGQKPTTTIQLLPAGNLTPIQSAIFHSIMATATR